MPGLENNLNILSFFFLSEGRVFTRRKMRRRVRNVKMSVQNNVVNLFTIKKKIAHMKLVIFEFELLDSQ